jgi:hypothetical protein
MGSLLSIYGTNLWDDSAKWGRSRSWLTSIGKYSYTISDMITLDRKLALEALSQTGTELAGRLHEPVRLIVAGSAAGLFRGDLGDRRVTGDCDVVWKIEDHVWSLILEAAAVVGVRMGLRAGWLNRNCSVFAWCFALGWASRCEDVGTFGPLKVVCISRLDLIAAKVVSAVRRAQDLDDLLAMAPTAVELDFAWSNLDRLEAEHLDGDGFEGSRAVVERLRARL